MKDYEKTKAQLVHELTGLRTRCGTLEILACELKQLETEIQDAREYAENIVETVREPLVVLNSALKILTANHSFYDTFSVIPEETIGNFIYDLGNRQWDIPQLRMLFEEILPHETVFNGYAVEHDFQGIGRKKIEGSSAIFEQILENRESAKDGVRSQVRPTENENRLVAQLLLKFLDTIADARKLQGAGNELIASTQKTAAWVSLSIIISVALFMIAVAWSIGRIISKGIKSLQQGAVAIGAGNFHHTITLEGGDEFATVAVAFNTMSGKLCSTTPGSTPQAWRSR